MLLPLLIALAPSQKADGPELTSGRAILPEEACYDVKAYQLNVRVDPQARSIQGRVLVVAKPLQASDDMLLDLDSRLKVEQVLIRSKKQIDMPEAHDRPVDFEQGNGEIRIHASTFLRDIGEEFVVTVLYGGVPREAPRPPWDGGFV